MQARMGTCFAVNSVGTVDAATDATRQTTSFISDLIGEKTCARIGEKTSRRVTSCVQSQWRWSVVRGRGGEIISGDSAGRQWARRAVEVGHTVAQKACKVLKQQRLGARSR